MTRILLLYGCSGFISLAYQVAWFRVFTDWFGSTNLTFALVVANFIGGLAVGALCSRRTTDFLARRLGNPGGLRVYGAVELAVAVAIGGTWLAAQIPADLFGSFPYAEHGGIWVHSAGYRFFQAASAAACVFVPCFFMGVTFPLLCDRYARHPRGARFPAALYAANTLGACTGVLACQFAFLPWLGHDFTLFGMAGANALLGAYCLLARSDFEVAPLLAAAHAKIAPAAAAAPAGALALVTVGGFLAGALEADLFKRITFVIELVPGASMSFVSFWAILAIFLASTAVHRAPRMHLFFIKLAIAAAAIYAALSWQYVDAIRDFVEARVLAVPVPIEASLEGFRNLVFPSSLIQLLVFTGILVFPPYFGVSLLLPHVCNRLQGEQRHLGLAYGLNTVAFCAGFLAFMLLVPRVNIFFSIKFFLALFAVCAAWMFWVRDASRLPFWKPATLLAAAGAAAMMVPADFDPSFFPPGTDPATKPVRAVRSNGAHTTFVVDVAGAPRLFFGRLQMSASNLRALTYMKLMAHFPLLLHPNPEKALLICLGVGNTGAAIASHPGIRQIDIVDLNHQVFETAPDLAAVNGELHLDPRVRFIHDDGRAFLNLTDQRYDLITSEPPPPLAAGVYRLYSREYYREVLAHLTPGGFMTQWLPLFLMTPESVEMAIATFVEAFPHTFVFTGFGTDFILVGSPAPIDFSGVAQRIEASPAAAAELAMFNIQSPESLLVRIAQSDAALRRRYGDAAKISDQRNDLEHLMLDPRARAVIEYDPADVLAFLRERAPEIYPDAEGILTHLGRLRFHVQGYPFETFAALESGTAPEIALTDVDWMALAGLARQNSAALRAGRRDLSLRILEKFLDASREQPEILIQLAIAKIQRRRYEAAIPLLREFQALEPDYYLGHWLLAEAYEHTGRSEEALLEYAEALRLEPEASAPREAIEAIRAAREEGARAAPSETTEAGPAS